MWKLWDSSKYLKGEVLKYYINKCLTYTSYDQIEEFLTEKFINVNIHRVSDFTALKLTSLSKFLKKS